jgi:enterochelin esterase-like enzyme
MEQQRRHAIVVNDRVDRIEHVEAQLNPPRVAETDIARDGEIEGFRAATTMLIDISQRTHIHLKEKNVPHVWHIDSGGHDFSVWRNDPYLFAQRIFRSTPRPFRDQSDSLKTRSAFVW